MTRSTKFEYLSAGLPLLYNLAKTAEYYLHRAPEDSLYKMRQFGERLPRAILGKAFRGSYRRRKRQREVGRNRTTEHTKLEAIGGNRSIRKINRKHTYPTPSPCS